MTSEKEGIVVVGEDKAILKLLSYKYDIKKTISYDTYRKQLASAAEGRKKISQDVDIIIFSEEGISNERFAYPDSNIVKTDDTYVKLLSDIYTHTRVLYYHPPKVIGFGNAALLLAKLNNATLLYDVTNHENSIHLNSFCMPDGKILEFDVSSNHRHLILPSPRRSFDVLAFSTFNNSQSYTHLQGDTFKASRDFIEIEGIKFKQSNSYCFLYDIPNGDTTVLIDLTLQLLRR